MMPTHYGPPQGNYMPIYMGGPVYAQQQQQPHQTEITPLSSNDVELLIRQQPKEALVTIDGKEKARKPVDPPPIIQLKVRSQADPQGHYMQSPYLIMIADLWHPEENEANHDKALSGTICSSLHRLKDVDNKDGAFFVFGDISIKQQGEHRLRFSLFDIHKPGDVYEFVTSIISDKFRVVSQKDFHGMDESTYLSRAFSDQGVRLRLRKEPRHVMGRGRKRSPPGQTYEQPQFQPPTPTNPSALAFQTSSSVYHGGYPSHSDASPVKRQRVDDESSPRYSASHISSSPSTQIVNRQGNYPVQSPGGMNLSMSSNWGYSSNYNYGRGLAMNNTSAAGELSGMAPPLSSSSMPLRTSFSTAHNSSAGLPPVIARGNSMYAGLEGFGDDPLNLGSSHHDRSIDSLPGGSSHNDYSGHTTESMRGMPVQSPVQNYQSNIQPGTLMAPFEGTASRAGSIHPGTSWPPVPPSRYEERCDRARSQYHLNNLQNPIGSSDGHHSSSHHSTSYDDQFKQDGYHFKTEGH